MKVIGKSDQIVDLKKSSKGFNIKKLQNLIETGLPSISQQLNQAVLVLGNTGSGKSTLINGLIGKKLIAVNDEQDKKVIKIELVKGEKGAKIRRYFGVRNYCASILDK